MSDEQPGLGDSIEVEAIALEYPKERFVKLKDFWLRFKNRNRIPITEDMNVHEEWYKEAHADDMSLKTLPKFLKKLSNDYEHDYGTIIHALTAGSIATMWSLDRTPQGGITGFQASCIMWQFIQKWMHKDGPLKMIEFNDMLYPQLDHRFDKTLSPETWKWLQEKAQENLGDVGHAHEDVVNHWRSIVDGQVPFGFVVTEEE